jgi:hypothetical protein
VTGPLSAFCHTYTHIDTWSPIAASAVPLGRAPAIGSAFAPLAPHKRAMARLRSGLPTASASALALALLTAGAAAQGVCTNPPGTCAPEREGAAPGRGPRAAQERQGQGSLHGGHGRSKHCSTEPRLPAHATPPPPAPAALAAEYGCLRATGGKCCYAAAKWAGCTPCPADAASEGGGGSRAGPVCAALPERAPRRGSSGGSFPRRALKTLRLLAPPALPPGPSALYGCSGEKFDRAASRLTDWSFAGYM